MIELKSDKDEFLLICAPHTKRLLPVFAKVALGPITVIFENTASVCGVKELPFASLSLSKASLFEMSATAESLSEIPNCTFPEKPLSVSKSSSRVLKLIRCVQFTVPPNHSKESSFAYDTCTLSMTVP